MQPKTIHGQHPITFIDLNWMMKGIKCNLYIQATFYLKDITSIDSALHPTLCSFGKGIRQLCPPKSLHSTYHMQGH